MSRFEVLERRGAPQVEGVLPNAAIAGAGALSAGDVCKAMFDGDTLPKARSAARRGDQIPQALLQRLIRRDLDRPAGAALRGRTAGARRAPVADRGVELNISAESERQDLTLGTGDGAVPNID